MGVKELVKWLTEFLQTADKPIKTLLQQRGVLLLELHPELAGINRDPTRLNRQTENY